jgi:DNA topoisomerase-6 subunit A
MTGALTELHARVEHEDRIHDLGGQAQYLGVTPQDIIDFKLQDATHKLLEVDIKRAKDALKNDPFFVAHKPWVKAIEQMLQSGVRAEQQALAKWGLNFVIEEYLPRKLKEKKFLP